MNGVVIIKEKTVERVRNDSLFCLLLGIVCGIIVKRFRVDIIQDNTIPLIFI